MGAWKIIPVDGAPLRRKAQRAYEKALRDVEAAKAESERFYDEDAPLYSKWLNSNFGPLLTQIRALQHKLVEMESLVAEVQQEFFFGGHRSLASAYRAVLHRRAHPEEEAQEESASDDEEGEEFRREFEEAFSEAAEDFWKRIGQNGHAPNPEKGPASAAAKGKGKGRLKELYRTLARRLHPDKTKTLTAKQKEWWHQTQAAYQAGNVEQLEMILTLIEVEEKGTRETSISALTQLTAAFKQRLRSLKRQLTELRREAAWNFSRRTDHSSLQSRIRISLEADRNVIACLVQKYQAQVTQWERTSERPRKRRAPAVGQWADEEWF